MFVEPMNLHELATNCGLDDAVQASVQLRIPIKTASRSDSNPTVIPIQKRQRFRSDCTTSSPHAAGRLASGVASCCELAGRAGTGGAFEVETVVPLHWNTRTCVITRWHRAR